MIPVLLLLLCATNVCAAAPGAPGDKKHQLAREGEPSPKRTRVQPSTAAAASAPASSSSSSSSAASLESDVSGVALAETDEKEAANQQIVLVSKEGKKFTLPREVALDPQVSVVISRGFEHNDKEVEIPLTLLTSDVLRLLTPILWQMHNVFDAQSQAGAAAQKNHERLVAAIGTQTVSINDGQLPQFMRAADYLESPLLLEALALRYAGVVYSLKDHQKQLQERLQKDGLGHDLLELVSQMYFLRFNTDGDPIIFPDKKTKTTIPFEWLKDWGKLSPALLQQFPNLGTEPNRIELANLTEDFEPRISDPNNPAFVPGLDEVGETALSYAAWWGNAAEVAALLKLKDIDVNARDGRGTTPLMDVFEPDVLEKYRLLLSAGADINFKNPDGRTALTGILATWDEIQCTEVRDIVKLFIQYNADVNAIDRTWPQAVGTPLSKVLGIYALAIEDGEAYSQHCVEAVELLIKARADVNVAETRVSPLRRVIDVRGAERMVEILKKAGARLRPNEEQELAPTQPLSLPASSSSSSVSA